MKWLALLALLTACRDDGRASTAHGEGSLPAGAKLTPVAGASYSPLAEITPQNARGLKVAWTYDTGSGHGHEGAPLVTADAIYVVTPFPNKLVALDFTGHVTWEATVPQNPVAEARACCDTVNHGAETDGQTIYFATLDDQVVAVGIDGAVKWTTTIGDADLGETTTAQPAVIAGKVLVGVNGAMFGKRGKLVALDAATGDKQWTAYSTGYDADVKIGPRFKPFYETRPEEGTRTWPSDAWERGGGDVSGFLAYDGELVYHGTGAAAPWNNDQRAGDNKFTGGVFARDPATGEAVWFYQYTPQQRYPYDGTAPDVLLDMSGRPVLVHADANGYVYVLDRKTGQVLAADPFVHVTESKYVDLKTGKLVENDSKVPRTNRVSREVCPSIAGAINWQPSAFSPDTGLLYIPHQTLCMDFEPTSASFIPQTPYLGATVKLYESPDADGNRGALTAWDPIARRAVWSIAEPFPVWSGALATAGGLVFYGTMDGDFKAVDAKTGTVVWSQHLPSGIVGQPVTFQANGHQYVAVYSGVGGLAGSIITNNLDPRDKSAGRGFAALMQDLPGKTEAKGRLYVFSL